MMGDDVGVEGCDDRMPGLSGQKIDVGEAGLANLVARQLSPSLPHHPGGRWRGV